MNEDERRLTDLARRSRLDAENWRAVAGNMAQCLLAAIEDLHRLGRRHADEQAHAMAEQYEHSFARQCRAHDVTP
jgi:hypothetical protein